ncbi:MAG: class I adenylate-forming enzyme family protein [Promethearchaeota archaeon]
MSKIFTQKKLTTKIPKEIVPPYFQPLEYGDPAEYFPPLGFIIKKNAALYANDTAVIDESDKTYSFKKIYDQSIKFCHGIIEAGFKENEKICVCMPDRIEWPIAFLGALTIGVVVPADDWVPAETTKYIIEHADIKYVVCLAAKVDELKKSGVTGVTFISVDEQVDGELFFPELVSKSYDDEKMTTTLDKLMNNQKSTDLTFILYTSGTTGMPKGAMLSHANIAYNMSETARYLKMSRENNDKVHCAPPFSHCFGNIFGILCAWYTGIPLAIMAKFDPAMAVKQISRNNLTITYGTPTQFRKMMPTLDDDSIYNKCLRTGIMAGEPCPPKLIAKMMELGCDIRVIYGLTEASPGTNATRFSDPLDKKSTVGRAYRGSVVRIEDPIDEVELPFGKEGEVVIYGPGVMMGYYNEPGKTAAVTSNLGGLKTGDIGIMDEQGFLVISGRIKNIVIRGGNNLYPILIESRMMQFLVDKVETIAIVGVHDEMYGEEIAAVVKTRPSITMSAQEFIDLCFDESSGAKPLLSHEEVPRYAFINEIDIPVSGRNKVLKNVLKKQLEEYIKVKNISKMKPSKLRKE